MVYRERDAEMGLSVSWSPETKKLVQELKEIVTCSETEIYNALVESNMNPDDAVQRLLSQDTFHKVKSKRERRKEIKESRESKLRTSYNDSSARGNKVSGRNGSNQSSHEENGNYPKRENMSVVPSQPPPSLPSNVKGKNLNQKAESSMSHSGVSNVAFNAQRDRRLQAASSRTSTGDLSVADVARSGQPSSEDLSDLHPQHAPDEPETVSESDGDDQAVVEQHMCTSRSSTPEASVITDGNKYSKSSGGDGSKASEGNLSNGNASHALGGSRCGESEPGSVSDVSDLDSSVAAAAAEMLLELKLQKELVVSPGHLRALANDFSQLSFGSFETGNSCTSTSLRPSGQLKGLLEASTTTIVSPSAPSGTRDGNFHRDSGYAYDSLVSSLHRAPTELPKYDLAKPLAEQAKELVEQHTCTSRSSTAEASVVTDDDKYLKSSGGDRSKASEGNLSNGSASHAVGGSRCGESEPGSVSNFSDLDSSVAAAAAEKLLELELQKEQVVFPGHRRALANDFSQLSFGSFETGNSCTFTSRLPSGQSKGLLEASTTTIVSPSEPLGTMDGNFHRDSGYAYDSLVSSLHRTPTELPKYDLAKSLAEQAKELDFFDDRFVDVGGRDRPFPHGEKIGRSTAGLSFARTDPIVGDHSVQNHSAFIESQPSDRLLMPQWESLRPLIESQPSDRLSSLNAQFLAKQLIPLRHGNTGSSLNSSSVPFPQNRQQLPGGPFSLLPLPSNLHRAVPSYSRPNLPFELPSNNVTSYSGIPQNFPRSHSVFQQQQYLPSDDFHQSSTGALRSLPEYRPSTSNRFFGSSSGVAEYGGGSSSNSVGLGSYPYTSASHMAPNSGYNNVGLHPRYSNRALFPSQQQNSSLATWNQRMQDAEMEMEYCKLFGEQQQFKHQGGDRY